MFFVGIFGIHSEEKKIKEIFVENYSGYPHGIKGDLFRNSSVFEFFFIPLFRFNKKYYVIFPNSQKIYFVEKDQAEEAIKKDSPLNFFNLIETEFFDNTCPDCGKMVEGNYKFCPYCGSEL